MSGDPWDAPVDVNAAIRLTEMGATVVKDRAAQEYVVKVPDDDTIADVRVPREDVAAAVDPVVVFAAALGVAPVEEPVEEPVEDPPTD